MDNVNEYSYAGQVDFQYLKLISTAGIAVDLNDYLIEFNLFEDIFTNFLHGQVLINDSNNLISKLPIRGDEFLVVSFGTPTLNSYFRKYFYVYSVTDQKSVSDNNTQTYILHFCSVESIIDANSTVFEAFNGSINQVVTNIFQKYLQISKYVTFTDNDIEANDQDTARLLFSETKNKIKFISPGWSPAKCLNWLCSKSLPREGTACDFLFWESIYGFFFASIEDLFIESQRTNKISGEYFYVPPGNFKSSDVNVKMFLAQNFEVVNFADNLKNYTDGFYANRIVTYDPIKKRVISKDFDYPNEYNNFQHLEGNLSVPNFSTNVFRNASSYIKLYPANSLLYSNVRENFPEKVVDIFGNRNTKLNELNNFKINITVHGRTDLYAGSIIRFNYPDTTAHGSSAEAGTDTLYTGNYLITAIRHKINFRNHVMVMELVKDSLARNK
jgi:hypothetical protein